MQFQNQVYKFIIGELMSNIYDALIIAEKPIAGQSIAQILSNSNYKTNRDSKSIFFEFENDFLGKCILIPLKGHITDVDFKKEYQNWFIDLKRLVSDDPLYYKNTEPLIQQNLSKVNAKKIIIATDADREGESIGREAVNIVLNKNPNIDIKRAYFSAITKQELNKSFKELIDLDNKIADAADSRREIDLYWGAVLTRFMSTNTKMTGKNFLSVGRVQSPTLAKVVEKELEIENFVSEPYWEIEIILDKNKNKILATYKKGRITDKKLVENIFEKITDKAKVVKIDKKENIISKPVPFNTTDFLRAATNINLDAMKAMEIAEHLYMKGYVSYPRTDNQTYIGISFKEILTNLKCPDFDFAINKILAQDKIEASKGVSTKDHPPIHPVSLAPKEKLSKDEWKVFKLIVDHFFATLYKDAKTLVIDVDFDTNSEIFTTKGITFIDKGWIEIYPYANQKENVLPELILNEILPIVDKNLLAKKTKPPARYSQGTLIKLMEKLNLGTKSTRPSILEKLYSRDYIFGKKQIVPSEMAKTVVKSLKDYAEHVVSPDMTAKLEDEMTDIENGKITKDKVVLDSKLMLKEILDDLYKNKKEISTNINETKLETSKVGICSICKNILVKRISKKGKDFVGCLSYPKCTNTYPLPQKGKIEFTNRICDLCKAPIILFNDSDLCININCKINKEHRDQAEKNKLDLDLKSKDSKTTQDTKQPKKLETKKKEKTNKKSISKK